MEVKWLKIHQYHHTSLATLLLITNDTNGWGPGLEFKQIKTKRDVGKPIMKQII